MDPRVVAALSANGGVIRYAQLLDLGVSPGEVRHLKRRNVLHPLRRGVYTTTELWDSLDEWSGRPRLVARAVILTVQRGWVLSHNSAADELGLATLRPPVPLTHLTRPGWTNAWTENDVKHHLAGFAESQVVETNGVKVLGAARTAVDIAREHGVIHGMVACDSALRLGLEKSALIAAYDRMDKWPGRRSIVTSVDLADGRAENPHESLGRHLVVEAGIGEPDLQFPVRTADGIKWCDIRVGNHIIETDGRIKYRSKANGGVADDVEQALWDEKQRERLVRDRRTVVTRVVWEDYWGRRRVEAVCRLRADHEESVRLYGRELAPELAEEAAAIRAAYGDRRPA
ncbi:type IV toxin-antitoxin system AbiEi family antitoxin domain-containing protein [Nocardioides antri]|uniref:Type IV toxin-antitoxin system AbiEi family antitoxin domain-containing protein n=1 Tax=Nocardioides antri TaxID=2607659 RepID=A0A5B1M4I8_9ACTN|nr:type IV toxin-antitoxin system AbiEi family antitoxin domain-containing protein [Nocardioides antri]KAA1427576.1 type IV toxin-antitoxin system AbiEi family antitoxin domain-containing protein [Nocardioides antri]